MSKKQKMDEGMIMVSSLLPVNRIDSLTGPRPDDNFEFKGLPGQFNEAGEKIMDDRGNMINEAAFSKQHYNAVAKILKESRNVRDVVYKLADMFESDNPKFDKENYIKACGE